MKKSELVYRFEESAKDEAVKAAGGIAAVTCKSKAYSVACKVLNYAKNGGIIPPEVTPSRCKHALAARRAYKNALAFK